METTKRIAAGTGKVMLAVLVGVLMPVLIWVALGVALNQKLRQRAVERKPATIGEVLSGARQADVIRRDR